MCTKEKGIYPAYFSKINSNGQKQIILLIIPNKENEGWHYLEVRKLFELLRGITSRHNGDFYCLNYIPFFRTENKLKSQGKVYKSKDFFGIVVPSEKEHMLKFNQYLKSDKMSYIVYADSQSLIKNDWMCQ